ncbi:MAG TPA: PaaX family transcriptional regulator [Rhodobacteraceae bacterium]|nr:PaaX family transcriptional regulator [Paracoccaceae bacterium]
MPAPAVMRALTAGAELRTWSLIVTIFGDMARQPGVEIPGPVLTALTRAMGVKPEATRVALHRLRKDGWIASRRAGRVSHYFLTAAGRKKSLAATARIYARHPPAPQSWHVAVSGPLDPPGRLALDGTMAAAGYVTLTAGAWLGPGPTPDDLPEGLFALDGAALHLPDWLRSTLAPPALSAAYRAYEATLATTAERLAIDPGGLSALDRAAIRILLVHGWRRLVLRHPDLPDGCFPADWPGARVRGRFHALLDRLGETTLAELMDAAPA